MKKHVFLEIMEAQKMSRTLYCGGYDLHPFPGEPENRLKENMKVYGFRNGGEVNTGTEAYEFYEQVVSLEGKMGKTRKLYAGLMAAIEDYLFYNLEISVNKCGLSIFKPQFGFFIQFGPVGMFLLQRLRKEFNRQEQLSGRRIVAILDCKPGDISTTQAGYFRGYMGSLLNDWGIDHSPFRFDIINPTPWMGSDVLVLEEKGRPALGLKLLREGKGLIYVNKTSNPSGPQYQDLLVKTSGNEEMALSLLNARDAYELSQKHGLENSGVSQFGLVVGATFPCDGSIRKLFPTYTGLNPGFGAQSLGKKDPLSPFRKVILELRSDGYGGISSSSRNHLFAWREEYGGSGKVKNLESDLIRAVNKHRELEEEAFFLPEVIEAGIRYPFD
ncbi:MAG: hypothetical protein V1690_03850 [Candidatus Moraniibacteriota bacterium]